MTELDALDDDVLALLGAEKDILDLVTLGEVAAAPGTTALAHADGHGATFQVGVFEAPGPDPRIDIANQGTLRLDTWSDVPGSTVNGHLALSNEESSIKGTFVAKVCPSR